VYINDTPQTPEVYLALFADDIYKGFVFLESCNAASPQWSRDVSAGTLRSKRIRLRPYSSLIEVDRSRLILY